MLKRLRRKFVLVSVASLAAVLAVLVVGINIALGYFNARGADDMLAAMAEHGGEVKLPGMPDGQRPWDYPVSPETPFETRYFAVYLDSGGDISEIRLEHISAIDAGTASELLNEARESGRGSGYVDRYRYMAVDGENGEMYLFLDCSRQLRLRELVLLVSIVGSLAVLCATGALLFAFSKRAISPVTRSVERQKRFITDAGHELKTPITAIMAAADVLALDDADNEWVQTIQRSGARLGRLTADLIDLSRFDESDPFPEKERMDLSSELEDFCAALAPTAKSSGHELACGIAPGVWVTANRDALRRVFGILLDNALRYSDEGGRIDVSLRRKHYHAVLEVANPCAGFKRETLSRMFERFYRGDESRSTSGTGVGLSMARAIAEALGGALDASYVDGRVTLTLALTAER